jgi:hypothetical protein
MVLTIKLKSDFIFFFNVPLGVNVSLTLMPQFWPIKNLILQLTSVSVKKCFINHNNECD